MKGNREELRRWNCRTGNTSTKFAKLLELETACQSHSPLCFRRKMDEWKRNEKTNCVHTHVDLRSVMAEEHLQLKKWKARKLKLKVG
jgi:hypothetical protein